LFFKGTRRGCLLLRGKPVFSEDLKSFHIEGLGYTLETKSILLKSAKWLYSKKVFSMISEKTEYNFQNTINQKISDFNNHFSVFNFQKGKLECRVSEVQPGEFFFNNDGLNLRFLILGKMKLKL
jgi:hypothetical protein